MQAGVRDWQSSDLVLVCFVPDSRCSARFGCVICLAEWDWIAMLIVKADTSMTQIVLISIKRFVI